MAYLGGGGIKMARKMGLCVYGFVGLIANSLVQSSVCMHSI